MRQSRSWALPDLERLAADLLAADTACKRTGRPGPPHRRAPGVATSPDGRGGWGCRAAPPCAGTGVRGTTGLPADHRLHLRRVAVAFDLDLARRRSVDLREGPSAVRLQVGGARDSPPGGGAWWCPGWARSRASAPAARRARSALRSRPCALAIRASRSTRAWFFSIASGENRGRRVAHVRCGERRVLADGPGEEAAPERAIGHEADARALRTPPGSRWSRARATTSEYSFCTAATGWTACARRRVCGGGFGHAEVLHLALGDEVLDRAGDVLDRDLRVDAVLVEEVDGVDPEPLQRTFAGRADALGPAGDAHGSAWSAGSMSKPNLVAITT